MRSTPARFGLDAKTVWVRAGPTAKVGSARHARESGEINDRLRVTPLDWVESLGLLHRCYTRVRGIAVSFTRGWDRKRIATARLYVVGDDFACAFAFARRVSPQPRLSQSAKRTAA